MVEANLDACRIERFLIKVAQFDVMCMAEFESPLKNADGFSSDIFHAHAEILSMIERITEFRTLRSLDHSALLRLSSAEIGVDEAATLTWRDCLLDLRECMVVTPEGHLLPFGLKFEIHRVRILNDYLRTGKIE